MKLHKGLILLFAIPVIMTACESRPACEVRPTTMVTQPDGTTACFEADGELCDADPCDADDDREAPWKKPSTKVTKK